MTKTEAVAQAIKRKTSNQGLLSFGNNMKNIIGARNTGKTIRVRIENTTPDAQVVYLCPDRILGKNIDVSDRTALNPLGLATGNHFSHASYVPDGAKPAEKLDFSALSPGQSLPFIASAIAEEPTQITAISMKSFTSAGAPENTNYGNTLNMFKVSHLEELKRTGSLNLDAHQSSKDVSTEILKIDLMRIGFFAALSQKDVMQLQINAGTKLDITLHVGARFSKEEYFYRQTKAGMEVLQEMFPGESLVDCGN